MRLLVDVGEGGVVVKRLSGNKKNWLWLTLAIILVMLIGYKIWGKLFQNKQVPAQANFGRNQMMNSVPMVSVVQVKPEPIRETFRLIGNIQPEEEIAIQPRISGRLISIAVEEGQAVRKGELIGEIDDETIRLQLQQSEANIANIKANLKQAEINVNKNKAEKERYQELLKNRYISQREYENTENSYLTAQASWEGFQAQLLSQEKNYELLKLQLTQTKLYSPINGVILQKLITPGANLTTGTTILTVAALDRVKLVFNVDQKDAAKMGRGNQVSFMTDAYPDQVFQGTIKLLSPIYDLKTRTLNLTAEIPNPKRSLIPGMFGIADVLIGGKSAAIAVPQDAVVNFGNRLGVFVVDSKQIAHFRPVQTGLTAQGKIEIVSGVQNGDLVVVVGQNRLRDEQQVQLLNGSRQPRMGTGERPGTKAGNSKSSTRQRERVNR